MGHQIEQFADGTAAFASANKSAWHRLGTVTQGAMTAQEAMRLAYLSGWNIELLPLSATRITPNGIEPVDVPEHVASVRTNPKTGRRETLGVVGSSYQVVQNEEHAEYLNILTEQSGAHFETAGSLKGGRMTFMTMKLPQSMVLAGVDATDWYIVALNSHDGSSRFMTVVTPIRVVCANTAHAALDTPYKFGATHSGNVKQKIAQARQALGLTFKYVEEFERAAERMIQAELTLAELRDVVDKVFPMTSDGKIAQKNAERRWGEISNLFQYADTQANCRGTRWAGYNALTEYMNHTAPARGAATERAKGEVRASRVISGSLDASMEKAFSLLTV